MAAVTAASLPIIISSSSSPASRPSNDLHRSSRYDTWRTPPSSPSTLVPLGAAAVKRPKIAFKPGSRAVPIPEGAVTGFRSATAVVLEGGCQETESSTEEGVAVEAAGMAAGKEMDAAREEQEEESSKVKAREVPVKSKAKQRRKRSDGSKLKLDKKPVDRSRAKKSRAKEENSKHSRVSELADKEEQAASTTESSSKLLPQTFKLPPGFKATDESSRYFQSLAGDKKAPELHLASDNSGPLAAQNRNVNQLIAEQKGLITEGSEIDMETHDTGLSSGLEKNKVFSVLLSNTTADQLNGDLDSTKQIAESPPQDLRASDGKLKDSPAISPQKDEIPAKAKSPVKRSATSSRKAITVTAKAIAQVNAQQGQENISFLGSQEPSSPQGLPAYGIGQFKNPHIASYVAKKPVLINGSNDAGVVKKKRATAKSKKEPTKQKKLRSPESAMRHCQRQEFLFGTSSQLVREDDPGYIRDLQLAIRASETEADSAQSADKIANYADAALPRASRMLWLAGAQRDGEEYSPVPEAPQMSSEAIKENVEPKESDTRPNRATADLFSVDLTESLSRPAPHSHAPVCEPVSKVTGTKLKLTSAPPRKRTLFFTRVTRPESPLSSHAALSQILSSHVASQPISTKAATSKSPKKSKSRTEGKVASMEKPEAESRKRPKAAVSTTDDPQPPPKRSRGRPRKNEAAAPSTPKKLTGRKRKQAGQAEDTAKGNGNSIDDEFVPIDEIEDDDPPSPSPPRRFSPTAAAQLDLSGPDATGHANSSKDVVTESNAAAAMGSAAETTAKAEAECRARAEARLQAQAEERKRLFAKITQAVKSAPRSADPKHPSWWEKMLLYDPIVIEDLTKWLNSGVLDAGAATGAGEADCAAPLKPVVVQKWCEANSVCCLWREGLRGGVKTKY